LPRFTSDVLRALALPTLTLQIAQPEFKLRCNLGLWTTWQRRCSRASRLRDSTLPRRVWPIPAMGQLLF
jgi:hypothetical protein